MTATATQAAKRSTARNASSAGEDDIRESLVNGRQQGTLREISIDLADIDQVHAFMIDIDCDLLRDDLFGADILKSPEKLYRKYIGPMLGAHPTLAKAEVRDSGHGLHVLLWLDNAIEPANKKEAEKLKHVANVINLTLPGDPALHGLTCMTRPVGAKNTKHGRGKTVKLLREGQPVSRKEILQLAESRAFHPSKLYMQLYVHAPDGDQCPKCGEHTVQDFDLYALRCYGCGAVSVEMGYRRFYKVPADASKE